MAIRKRLFSYLERVSYFGVLLCVLFGLFIHYLAIDVDFFTPDGIVLFVVAPALISFAPILQSKNGLFKSKRKLFLFPFLGGFLCLFLSSGKRDLLGSFFIFIIGVPFYAVTGILGIGIGSLVRNSLELENSLKRKG